MTLRPFLLVCTITAAAFAQPPRLPAAAREQGLVLVEQYPSPVLQRSRPERKGISTGSKAATSSNCRGPTTSSPPR